MPPTFIFDGPPDAAMTMLLAHGAGAPMDSPSMTAASKALASAGFRVARFEFGYMASRRSGKRKPPPRAETLNPEYREAVEALDAANRPLIIGGRSMGGRVASMVADELFDAGRIQGLLCLAYPFHPPGRPGELRTAHLADIRAPTLIVQGTRDEFGNEEQVSGYRLSDSVELLWLPDADHDLVPRKGISGYSKADHLRTMAEAVSKWAARVTR